MILVHTRSQRFARLWRAFWGPPTRALGPLTPIPIFVTVAVIYIVIVGVTMLFLDPVGQDLRDDVSALTLRFFRIVTNLGNSGVWLWPCGIAIIALITFGKAKVRTLDVRLGQLTLRLGFFFAAVALSGIIVTVSKRLIGRFRPNHLGDGSVWQFDLFAWTSNAASFPSGHATTAFAVATALTLLGGRRVMPFAFAVAFLVALSRIIVGAHFASDVVAGAIFGTFFTLWYARYLARRRIVFEPDSVGGLALRGNVAPKSLFGELVRHQRQVQRGAD